MHLLARLDLLAKQGHLPMPQMRSAMSAMLSRDTLAMTPASGERGLLTAVFVSLREPRGLSAMAGSPIIGGLSIGGYLAGDLRIELLTQPIEAKRAGNLPLVIAMIRGIMDIHCDGLN